jgi:NAD(P)-dependent dehydrogenase (short-subunit alcohol dehydrogenase family)
VSSEPHATRLALVTGGSGGIGRDTAIRVAADGFRVVVNYAGHVAEADAVVAEIEGDGGEALALLQVLWSIEQGDWQDSRLSLRNLLLQLRPGAIILFHEQGKLTLLALRWLLGELGKRALQPVTVPDLLAIDGPDRRTLSLDARARSCTQP